MIQTAGSTLCYRREMESTASHCSHVAPSSEKICRRSSRMCWKALTRSHDLARSQPSKRRFLQRCNIRCAHSEISAPSRPKGIAQYQHEQDGVLIRPAQVSELEDVAWLRAEAYYEVCELTFRTCRHQTCSTYTAFFLRDCRCQHL